MVEVRGPYSTHELHAGVFSPAECDRIIELGRQRPVEVAGLEGDDGTNQDDALRSAEIAWLPAVEETAWVLDRLGEVCDDSNHRYGFELDGFGEDLQFTTYRRPGAFYTWHQDGLDGPVANRKLSIVVQLSDPEAYEGADLELFQVVEDYDPDDARAFRRAARARGSAMVFPAFEYHRVTPLVGGVRHSLVSWVSGPPFR
jgi:PKHD-type hydroxylase